MARRPGPLLARLTAAIALLCLVFGCDAENVPVTCGSTLKLSHVKSKYRLHSHEVSYSRGSQQQSVTAFPTGDDGNSYWVVHGVQESPCTPGYTIPKKAAIRLQHANTRKWLHSHKFQSPLTSQQEVSAFGSDESSDGGDVWIIDWDTTGKIWKQDTKIKLKHRDTSVYLASYEQAKFGQPIHGQQEVCGVARADGSNAQWQAAEGVFMPREDAAAAGGSDSKPQSRRAHRTGSARSSLHAHAGRGSGRIGRQSATSLWSEGDEFHSCKDDFSVADGMSPLQSPRTSRAGAAANGGAAYATPFEGAAQRAPSSAASYVDSEPGDPAVLGKSGSKRKAVTCMTLLNSLSQRLHHDGEMSRAGSKRHPHEVSGAVAGILPVAGFSLAARDVSLSALDVSMAYENGDAEHFRLRSIDYAKTKVKVSGASAIYQVLAADMFSTDVRTHHVAQMVTLPPRPQLPEGVDPREYPPLLVINLQMPAYAPSVFGGTDGKGWNVVLYFGLPPDFQPDAHPNQKALALLRRFVANQKEADGTPTRDRFKIIPRIVNVDQWATTAPLSSSEYKLLSSYNEKPVLSRPQHTFFHGPHYLEVDIDIHAYAYVARVALQSFLPRLGSAVWDVAFVIQGNNPDELPEQVLATARLHRVPFLPLRPYMAPAPLHGAGHGGA